MRLAVVVPSYDLNNRGGLYRVKAKIEFQREQRRSPERSEVFSQSPMGEMRAGQIQFLRELSR